MRTFKKYANRKLYSTQDSKYVNLTQLYNEVKGGVTVIVTENKTGRDVTLETLKQAVMRCKPMSLDSVEELIRND